MKITVVGVPHYRVVFTRPLVDALFLLAEGHYDSQCRGLVTVASEVPGSINGLLTIVRQYFDMLTQAEFDYMLTFRQMDILAKVCEQPQGHLDEAQRAVIREFRQCAFIALRRANDHAANWTFDVTEDK